MKAGSRLLNAVSAVALSAGVVSLGAGLAVVTSASVANAATIQRIEVVGASRVGSDAVKSNLTIKPGKAFSNSDIDESVKRLYETGFFANVNISVSGGALVVKVKENELVNQVVFNGNRKIKSDKLSGIVKTQPLGPYSTEMVNADIERIKQAYAAIGRNDVKVTTQTYQVSPGRVNLAFVINEGDRTKIAAINFSGNHAFSDSRLASVMQTKKSNPLSFLTRRDVFSEEKLHSDEDLLRQFYYDHGYADFRILSADASLNEQTNAYTINISVDEGRRYTFGDINIESSVPNIDASQLKSQLLTSKGDVYNASKIQKTMEALSKAVSAKGYPFVRIVPRGNRDPQTGTIGVTYMVDQGERAYVERIEIRGNTRTRDYVIRREFDFSEGDAFNQEMIARAKRRLEALGYFSSVNITTKQGSAPDRVIVVVNVEDQPTGSFGIGAGYSVGGSGLILEASVEEKNFLGRGQYIRVAAGAGTDDSQTYNLSFTEPYFLGYRLAVGFDLFKSTTSSNDYYKYDEQGGTFRVTAPITDELATTFRYTYKQIKYRNNGAFGADGIAGTSDDTMSQTYIDLIEGSPWTVSSVSQSLTYNTLDSQTMPHEGIYATVTQEYAGLGGDSNYYKLFGKARYYKTLSDQQDIIGSLSIGGGHVFSTGDGLHVFDQFQLGGTQVRGFENNGIGPRTVKDGDALGGTTYITASAEATAPFPGISQDIGLRLAVFSDAGTLYGSDVSDPSGVEGNSMSWRASVGAGVVWASPFGPLRFDFAQPVVKESYDKVQQFRFSIANQF